MIVHQTDVLSYCRRVRCHVKSIDCPSLEKPLTKTKETTHWPGVNPDQQLRENCSRRCLSEMSSPDHVNKHLSCSRERLEGWGWEWVMRGGARVRGLPLHALLCKYWISPSGFYKKDSTSVGFRYLNIQNHFQHKLSLEICLVLF